MKGEAAESSDYYECSMTPKNAAEECKTGITFKGNDEEYVNAQKKVLQMIKKKGEPCPLHLNITPRLSLLGNVPRYHFWTVSCNFVIKIRI